MSRPDHKSDLGLNMHAERIALPAVVILLSFAAVAVPILVDSLDLIKPTILVMWGLAMAAIALSVLIRFLVDFIRGGRAKAWTSAESALVGLAFAALAWLDPSLAGHPAGRFLLAALLIGASAVGALNAWYLAAFRRAYIFTVIGIAIVYSLAYLWNQEWMLTVFVVVWTGELLYFARIGFNTLAELARLRRESERDAQRDDLTTLHSRTSFISELAVVAESGRDASLLLIDLDGFKAINDGFGHPTGDAVLRTVAKRLVEAFPADTVVGRLGGDEFAAIVPVAARSLSPVVESVLARIAEPIRVSGRTMYVAGSGGWTEVNRFDATAELMAQADTAMYASKNSSTIASTEFNTTMRDEVQQSLAKRQAFRTAVKDAKFEFAVQPIVQADTAEPVAVELLARWPQHLAIQIGPGDFNRLADETGLAVELDRLALAAAQRLLTEWRDDPLLGRLVIKANISPLHLHNMLLLQSISEMIETYDRDRLGLEFIESKLITSAERISSQLRVLKSMGVTLSIDDFGVGYSSLSYLRHLAVSELKIDRSFIDGIDSDSVNQGLVGAIVDLASTLGLPTVAEGVESPEELATVRQLGVSSIQGYIYSRPVPISEAATSLRTLFGNATAPA